MNVEVYSFPTLGDGKVVIESKYCELLNKYRAGEYLNPEAIDWMDSANTWLSTTNG